MLSQYEYFSKDLVKMGAPSKITSTYVLALSWMFAKNNTNYYSLNVPRLLNAAQYINNLTLVLNKVIESNLNYSYYLE